MNFYKNKSSKVKIIKTTLLITILLIAFIIVSAISYVSAVSENIANSVFRLHVIANSDSEEDQNLKFIVRDNLIEYMNSLTSGISSKQAAIEIAKEHKQDFYNIAKKTIEDNGYDYDVNIEIGNSYFPTKYYGDISFPAGYYDALKVEIGKASGQNWWCVMFPPLCFVDMSTGIVPEESKETIKDNLPEEEYALISDTHNNSINFKFKLIEFFYKK
ncbi:MAG: stage II sporulation protein R [Clostridia bacterium]|nr:stage II sporulation protein R [Clostridia bacterium]